MNLTNTEWIGRQIEPFGPKCPLSELVEELNRFYHEAEAHDYDAKHAEIFQQLPGLWSELIDIALCALQEGRARILDFGSGTGFEAKQILTNIPRDRVATLTCYDLSADMLAQCRKNIAPLFSAAQFTASLKQVEAVSPRFNLLATNSLLHHLPDVQGMLRRTERLLDPGAVWIAGHEPSSRFYNNPACVEALEAFQRERRWRRYVTPRNYWNRVRALVGLRSSPARFAADKALESGLFERRPSEFVVSRLVDFHVPHSATEAAAGRGLDFENLAEQLQGRWRLIHIRSYSFMGSFYEDHLPGRWQRIARELAKKYPNDGSNFCTVWSRV